MKNCKICNSETNIAFETYILKKYKVKYFLCSNCGFLQSESPYWLNEAYELPINIYDTDIIHRNLTSAKITSAFLLLFFNRKASFLDYAGGYGIFTRIMRDIGFNFYWSDTYSKNLVANGFEYFPKYNIELITTFESFEHFVYPTEEMEKLLKISKNIFFTTSILPNLVPDPEAWDYYGFYHGQHISFYQIKTLKHIANKYGLNFYTDGKCYHLFTEKKINGLVFYILRKASKFLPLNTSRVFMKSFTVNDKNKLVAGLT